MAIQIVGDRGVPAVVMGEIQRWCRLWEGSGRVRGLVGVGVAGVDSVVDVQVVLVRGPRAIVAFGVVSVGFECSRMS